MPASSIMPIWCSPLTIRRDSSGEMNSERSEKKERVTGRGSTCTAGAAGTAGTARRAISHTGQAIVPRVPGREAGKRQAAVSVQPAGLLVQRRGRAPPTAILAVGTLFSMSFCMLCAMRAVIAARDGHSSRQRLSLAFGLTQMHCTLGCGQSAEGHSQVPTPGPACPASCPASSSSCPTASGSGLTAVSLHVDENGGRVGGPQVVHREGLVGGAQHLCSQGRPQPTPGRSKTVRPHPGRSKTAPSSARTKPVLHGARRQRRATAGGGRGGLRQGGAAPEMIPLTRVSLGRRSTKEAPAEMPSPKTGSAWRLYCLIQFSSTYLTPHLSSPYLQAAVPWGSHDEIPAAPCAPKGQRPGPWAPVTQP